MSKTNNLRIALYGCLEATYHNAASKRELWTHSLTNSFRKILYGGYYSLTLPAPVPTTIRTVQDERWKKILTKAILVRHNHLRAFTRPRYLPMYLFLVRHNHEVAAKQFAKAAVHDQAVLTNASGVIGAAAPAPFPKEFFESIN